MTQPIHIAGSSIGLKTDQKPFLLPENAFQVLKNAYVYRDRTKKREGLFFLGRLRRTIGPTAIGISNAGHWIFILYNALGIPAGEVNKEIQPGSVVITIGATVLTDQGNGLLQGPNALNYGTVNYINGIVDIVHTAGVAATTVALAYYPSLPVMGIIPREIALLNDDVEIFFDTKYSYTYAGTPGMGGAFVPFTTTTWDASDSNFFQGANYRGSAEGSRLLFVTNFLSTATNQLRYTDGTTWTLFNPALTNPANPNPTLLFGCLFFVPYYGRLLALNTIEGTAIGSQANIFNRCRFSQIGDPTQVDAWAADIFGKGGFIDAPVNESITGIGFIKNTLIVTFEYSTWALNYVGEYGLPFVWGRVSSEYGSCSPYASIVFNDYLATMGDRAIIAANSTDVKRIDTNIPDLVFTINGADDGVFRVHGERDYRRELIYWSYTDATSLPTGQYFPNTVLVYNYRNNSFAQFRDSVTCFGKFQSDNTITWDSQEVTWNDDVTWDDVESNRNYPFVVSGNQQGFAHLYQNDQDGEGDDESLSITAIANINSATLPIQLTIVNHNLQNFELIFIQNLNFVDVPPDITLDTPVSLGCSLNNSIFQVQLIDNDNVSIYKWDYDLQQYYFDIEVTFTPTPAFDNPVYMGGGTAALLPKLDVKTKDFNPYQAMGSQLKLTHVDFLMDATASAQMTVNININTTQTVSGNMLLGNTQVETSLPAPYYVPGSDISWHRFFANVAGQYINLEMTYDDNLMNDITTHEQLWALNAITLYCRQGGKLPF